MRRTTKVTAVVATLAATVLALAPVPGQALGLVPTVVRTAAPPGSHSHLVLGGKPCRLVEVPAAAPLGLPVSCPGVRPGAAVFSPVGMCTFNFLWTGSDGARYAGTAGHCILDVLAEVTWTPGRGPGAADSTGQRVGEFAYAILGEGMDFALIRLDPGVESDPSMCHFGGPTGVNADRPGLTQPTVLHHYGQGATVSVLLPARSHLALGMPSAGHVFAVGVVQPGDSGSGMISADGRAVGLVVTLGIHSGGLGLGGIDAGTVGITRLGPQVDRASQRLGVGLDLITAPLR